MMDVPTVLTAFILVAFFSNLGQCCGPAEIGQPYTIISTANISSVGRVVWELREFSLLYDSSSPTPNAYPQLYVGTRTGLTIKSVTKNDGINAVQHVFKSYIVFSCQLPVYERAIKPICEPVTVIGNQIRTKCSTAQVFPQAKCHFTLQNGDRKDIPEGPSYITYTHTDPQPGGNEYFSTSCTLQYPVDGLKPGTWTVQVNMYPNQTGVSLAQGTTGGGGSTLLSVPTVTISKTTCPKGLSGGDTNVRDGYIRQGERASCLCTRAHAGNPLGAIGWSSTQGGNFVNMSQSKDAATIQINAPDTFTCQSRSVLDGSHFDTYTPKYAYGPNSASLTFQRPGPIYLCPNQQTNIDITCQVPANSFNPATLFTIRDSNSNNLVTTAPGDTVQSKSVNYNFTKSGQHTFTCQVKNTIFDDIYSEAPVSGIQAYAPPNRPPLLNVTGQSIITNGSETWVKQGSNISVSCVAGEAYPLVYPANVTVTCGQKISSNGSLYVSEVRGDNLTCQCDVDHETKTPCNSLNLNKEMKIDVAYGPSEVTLSFPDREQKGNQNETLSLCDPEGLEFTVICAVTKSDVRPGLTFTLTKPNNIYPQNGSLNTKEGVYSSVNNLKVTTVGIYTLHCEAMNEKYSDIKQTQSLTIEVRAPPNRPPVVEVKGHSVITENSEIWVKQRSAISVSCEPGVAYPLVNPANVAVTCGQEISSSGPLYVSEVRGDNLTCQCDVDHETKTPCQSLNLTKNVTIQVAYGPSELMMSFVDDVHSEVPYNSFNLCSLEALNLTLVCAVKQSNVQPGLTNDSFNLIKHNAFIITQQSYDFTSEDTYRSIYKLNFTDGGNHTLTCEARNSKYLDINQIQTATIEIREPPREPPKISARNAQSSSILEEGDDVLVTCIVSGGYPSVNSVTLTCGKNESVTTNGTTAELTLKRIELYYNETNCRCEATHVTGCYDLTSVLGLTVLSSKMTKSEQEDSSPTGAAVGGVIGALVVLAVVVGGIFFIRRRMKKKEHPSPETGAHDPHQEPFARDGTILQEDEVMKDNVVYIPHEVVSSDVRPVDGLVSGNEEGKKVDPYEDVEIGNASILIEVSQAQSSQNDATGDPVNATVAKTILQKQEINPYENMETKDATNPVEEAQAQSSQGDSSMYTTVAKIKNERLTSFNADKTDAITTAATSGEAPVVPERRYYEEDVTDSVNEPPTGKGKKKNILETLTEKMKKKKETKKKDKDKVFATDYTEVKPTMTSAAAYPKNYNPENNPYEDVEMKTVPQHNEQGQARSSQEELTGASVYTTVAKLKRQKSTSSDADKTDDITTAATSGEAPEIPERHYDEENVTDSVNEPPTGKEKKKNILEKLTEKKKKKEKKEKKEKKKKAKEQDRKLNLNQTNGNEGTTASEEDDHIYSNETLSRRADGDLYANMAKSMNSLNDVDDGTYRNEDGLLYTTIAGVASLKAVQTPVHHPRKEEPVDYADIDFDQILANRENPA